MKEENNGKGRLGFIQGFQPHRWELWDLSFPSLTPSPLGSFSTILAATPSPLIFDLSSLQVPGPPHLPPTSTSLGQPQHPRWVSLGRGQGGGLVGKRSGEVSQCELSADGFVIGHKTGAFRFVNQSRLSHSINVRFIGSKKALSSRLALVYLNMDIPRIRKKCGHFNRTCPACLRVILLLFFLSLKIISQFQRLLPSHAPAYYIVSLICSYFSFRL